MLMPHIHTPTVEATTQDAKLHTGNNWGFSVVLKDTLGSIPCLLLCGAVLSVVLICGSYAWWPSPGAARVDEEGRTPV